MSWNNISIETEQVTDTNPDLYIKRAENELSKGNVNGALKEVDVALRYCSSDKQNHYLFEKVKVLYAANKNSECKNLVEKNMKSFYNTFDLNKFNKVLTILVNAGNYKENRIRDLLISNSIPWVLAEEFKDNNCSYNDFSSKANKYFNNNDYEMAIQYCDLAIKVDDSKALVYYIKAYCYHRLCEYDLAIKNYTKNIKLDSRNADAYNNKALILSYMGKHDEALDNFTNAIDISPNEMLYINNKGDELLKVNRYEDAERYLLTKIEEKNFDAKTYHLLGQTYDGMKKYIRALHYYKKAMVIDKKYSIPNNEDREQKLSSLKKKVIILFTTFIILAATITAFQLFLFKNGTVKPFITNIIVDKSADFVEVGKSIKLSEKHKIFPSYGEDSNLSFISLDEEIAKVQPDGILTGVTEGEVYIALMRDNKKVDEIVVEVRVPKIEGLYIRCDENNLKYGDVVYIDMNVLMNYDKAQKPSVEFISSDPNIVTVSNIGEVEAVGLGTAEVLVRAENFEEKIVFNSEAIIEEIWFEKNEYEINVGEELILEPVIIISPSNATIPEIEYKVPNSDIISVDREGKIKAVSEGSSAFTVICGQESKMILIKVNSENDIVESNYAESKTVESNQIESNNQGDKATESNYTAGGNLDYIIEDIMQESNSDNTYNYNESNDNQSEVSIEIGNVDDALNAFKSYHFRTILNSEAQIKDVELDKYFIKDSDLYNTQKSLIENPPSFWLMNCHFNAIRYGDNDDGTFSFELSGYVEVRYIGDEENTYKDIKGSYITQFIDDDYKIIDIEGTDVLTAILSKDS